MDLEDRAEAKGFIDIHSHILFSCDDGPEEIGESLKMIKAYSKCGFTVVCATPHIIVQPYVTESESLSSKLDELKRRTREEGIDIELLMGAEYYLDAFFFERFEKGDIITIGKNGTYILTELPLFTLPDYIWEMAFKIQLKNYIPILAHPERYHAIVEDISIMERFIASGFIIQVNIGSFAGRYGNRVKVVAERLLKNDMIDIIASDSHRSESVTRSIVQGLKRVRRLAGEETIRRLLIENPAKILRGISIR